MNFSPQRKKPEGKTQIKTDTQNATLLQKEKI